MLRIEDVSEENLEDVVDICSGNRPWETIGIDKDNPILEKGRELKRPWLLDMSERYGSCVKIAYLDEKPVAQVLFYPEEAMPYLHNPRKDVIYLKCIYNSVPEARGKRIGAALLKALINECHTGLDCLGGKPCRFVVTRPFPHEGDLPLGDFYEKYGFKQNNQEMFLEIKAKYMPREIPEYRPLPEDRGRIILTYNPDCEWGYFFATTARQLIQDKYPDLPIETYNNWEKPEEYKKRPHLPLIAASTIVNAQVINSFVFWTDRKAYLRNVEEALRR